MNGSWLSEVDIVVLCFCVRYASPMQWRIWFVRMRSQIFISESGEFHEFASLQFLLLYSDVAPGCTANLAQLSFILRYNVYNFFNLNFEFEDICSKVQSEVRELRTSRRFYCISVRISRNFIGSPWDCNLIKYLMKVPN